MKDQRAEIARSRYGPRPSSRTAFRPGAGLPQEPLDDGLPYRPRGGRIGRSRGRALVAALAGLVIAASGCTGSPDATAPAAATGRPTASPTPDRSAPEPSATPSPEAPALPAPDAPIPKAPARLADSLKANIMQLRRAIDAWRRDGDPAAGEPPEPVVLLTLYQQRVYRHLARDPGLAARTYAELPKSLAREAEDNVTAIRDLLSLVRPVSKVAAVRVAAAEPADVLLRHFRHAERRFGVEWEVLAAVMFVETKFGRVRSPSHTGAKGPMQFMPRTWEAYGMGGDVHDTRDAVLAAANYLHASGAPRDYRRALYAYNHSQRYVNAVLRHARQIKRDIRNYYAYYNWQVYVVTTRGDRRLTGPDR